MYIYNRAYNILYVQQHAVKKCYKRIEQPGMSYIRE